MLLILRRVPAHRAGTRLEGRTAGEAGPFAHPSCSPSRSAAVQVRQWSCGIAMWVEPRNLKASLTALAKHGTPPTLGLSPTPLAPIGWCGEGVVVQSVSHFGVSTAVGRK